MSIYCVCVVWVHVMTDPTVEMVLLGLFQERQHFKYSISSWFIVTRFEKSVA